MTGDKSRSGLSFGSTFRINHSACCSWGICVQHRLPATVLHPVSRTRSNKRACSFLASPPSADSLTAKQGSMHRGTRRMGKPPLPGSPTCRGNERPSKDASSHRPTSASMASIDRKPISGTCFAGEIVGSSSGGSSRHRKCTAHDGRGFVRRRLC